MLTRQEVDAIHEALDRASLALEDVSTALLLGKVAQAKEDVFRVARGLGDCKEALRVVGPGQQ